MNDLPEDEDTTEQEDDREDEAEAIAVDSAIDTALASTEASTRVLGAIAVYLRDIARALSPCGQFDTVQESIDEVAKAISEREGNKI
jgi:F420-dependent methylenetetrahydromethanopterin dehydrogenase